MKTIRVDFTARKVWRNVIRGHMVAQLLNLSVDVHSKHV
jgi:hypothetical protein